MWQKKLRIVPTAVVLFFAASTGSLADFDYPDFASVAGLTLNGDAAQTGDRLRVTPAQGAQHGSVWYDVGQSVHKGFVTDFEFQITDIYGGGADGLAFAIQNTSLSALGSRGGGIGYGVVESNPGIANSLVVEFDTQINSIWGDPDSNHISVQTRGLDENRPDHQYSLGATSSISNMSDGNVHTVRIAYAPGTLSVFLDDLVNPALVVSVDLSTTLNLNDGGAWVGFTAATGAVYENHDVLSWSFTEGTPCESDTDCYDGDLCTVDTCEGAPEGYCVYTPVASRPYADVFPVPDGDGAVEIMDTLCILDAANGVGECLTDVNAFVEPPPPPDMYMIGDIYPCWPPEGTGPDGAIEIMDTLAVLDAASGNPGCEPWCP